MPMPHASRATMFTRPMVLCLLLALSCPARAESTPAPAHAPRVFSLTAGLSYGVRNRLPIAENPSAAHPVGALVGARMGWQVAGLDGGRPSSVGFESDFAYQDAHRARASYGLLYGVFAKHALTRAERLRPFFSYGLGAGQVWVPGVSGRGIGHSTRLAFGVDVQAGEGLRATFMVAYHALILRSLAEGEAAATHHSTHALVVSVGPWFGR